MSEKTARVQFWVLDRYHIVIEGYPTIDSSALAPLKDSLFDTKLVIKERNVGKVLAVTIPKEVADNGIMTIPVVMDIMDEVSMKDIYWWMARAINNQLPPLVNSPLSLKNQDGYPVLEPSSIPRVKFSHTKIIYSVITDGRERDETNSESILDSISTLMLAFCRSEKCKSLKIRGDSGTVYGAARCRFDTYDQNGEPGGSAVKVAMQAQLNQTIAGGSEKLVHHVDLNDTPDMLLLGADLLRLALSDLVTQGFTFQTSRGDPLEMLISAR